MERGGLKGKAGKLLATGGILLIGVVTVAASPHRTPDDAPIRALSSERIEGLRAGQGLGYALAAELNGYPGPRHVLDLATPLGLSDEQEAAARNLFDAMKAEAVPLGRALLAREQAIEDLFRSGTVSEYALLEATAAAASVEARLRTTHLKYHIRMADLMTARQRRLYDRLRGYVPDSQTHGGPGRHPH